MYRRRFQPFVVPAKGEAGDLRAAGRACRTGSQCSGFRSKDLTSFRNGSTGVISLWPEAGSSLAATLFLCHCRPGFSPGPNMKQVEAAKQHGFPSSPGTTLRFPVGHVFETVHAPEAMANFRS